MAGDSGCGGGGGAQSGAVSKGLSLGAFLAAYGTEDRCHAALVALREAFGPRRYPAHGGIAVGALSVSALVAVAAFYNLGRPQFFDAKENHPSVVHRTRMSAARRRVARALRTLRTSVGDLEVVTELTELGRWLEEFHARSWVELDYAGLALLMGAEAVTEDTSVADVAAAVTAVAEGDDPAAAARYRAVMERWAAVQVLAHAN